MKKLMILSIIALLSFSATSMFGQPTPKVTGDETQTVNDDYNSKPTCNVKQGKQKEGKRVHNKKNRVSHGKKVNNRKDRKGQKGTKCKRQSAKTCSKGQKTKRQGKKVKHHAEKRKSRANS